MNKARLLVIFFLILLNNYNSFAIDAGGKTHIKIASGSIMKGYYDIGLKLCDFFQKSNKDLRCEVVATSGSVENLELLKNHKVDLAIVQSNLAVDAFSGAEFYENHPPLLELRQVLNLYDEVFTIITKDDDNIKIFADIAGKRITNGPVKSGSSITYKTVRSLYNFTKPIDVKLPPEEYANKLCEGKIDAIILMVGHPNALVNQITNKCNVEFVTIEAEKLAKLMENNKGFKRAILAKGTYPEISFDQSTIAVSAILITTASMDPKTVKNFMIYFKQNIQKFKQSSFMLENLKDEYFTSNFVLPIPEKLMRKN